MPIPEHGTLLALPDDCLVLVASFLNAADHARQETVASRCKRIVALACRDRQSVLLALTAMAGDAPAVTWLLLRGAPPDAVHGERGDSPLHALSMWAVSGLHYLCIDFLLDAGARVYDHPRFLQSPPVPR